MGAKKNNESEVKVREMIDREMLRRIFDIEQCVIALERALEAVLRRLEESGQPDDAPGWYGRPE